MDCGVRGGALLSSLLQHGQSAWGVGFTIHGQRPSHSRSHGRIKLQYKVQYTVRKAYFIGDRHVRKGSERKKTTQTSAWSGRRGCIN